MAPKYKLTYFTIKGLGEPIRFLLSYMGENFEDNRIQRESWPELKSSFPFGKLPLLEIDGKPYTESRAIYRYLGKQANLAGDNDLENLNIDIIADVIGDLGAAGLVVKKENDEERKKSMANTFLNETKPFMLKKIEDIAKENGGFLANKKLSWADVMFAAFVEVFSELVESEIDFLDGCPTLKALQDKVFALPKIKEYVQKRPDTPGVYAYYA